VVQDVANLEVQVEKMIFMTETQLVESNQNTNTKKRGLLENQIIEIQIRITKITTVMTKMMTDITTKGETMTGETMTVEIAGIKITVLVVVANLTTKITMKKITKAVEVNITLTNVTTRTTKDTMMIPAITTKIASTLTATNASRSTAHTMTKLDTQKTTLSTKEDILELRMTLDELTAEKAMERIMMSLKNLKMKKRIVSMGIKDIREKGLSIVTSNMKTVTVYTKKMKRRYLLRNKL